MTLFLYPALQHKLGIFERLFLQKAFRNKFASPHTNLVTLLQLNTNLSQKYRLKCWEILDTSIEVAPAYQTRI
jgi:hypothetical protein